MVQQVPQYQKENYLLQCFQVSTVWSSDKSAINVENDGIVLTEKNRSTRKETSSIATLSTSNLKWICMGSSSGLRCDRPTTDHLRHVTAIERRNSPKQHIKSRLISRREYNYEPIHLFQGNYW